MTVLLQYFIFVKKAIYSVEPSPTFKVYIFAFFSRPTKTLIKSLCDFEQTNEKNFAMCIFNQDGN